MADYITSDDVRHFIFDRNIQDNDLLLDLNFSEEEVRHAMVRAAREYNSVPPFVHMVDPAWLPADTNIFLDGIAMHLYIGELSKLMRNDIDYNTGNVTTNLVAKRIEHLKELIKMHSERFVTAAKNVKLTANIHAAFRNF